MTDQWQVLYTRPRYEKKLYEYYTKKGIEVYLPLIKTMRQWSDRRKMVEEPLFKSYIFVKITTENFFTILNAQGAVRFVVFNGEPAVVSREEIEIIQKIIVSPDLLEVEDYIYIPGAEVVITNGPFRGVKGILSNTKRKRLLVQIEQLGKTVSLDISSAMVESVRNL